MLRKHYTHYKWHFFCRSSKYYVPHFLTIYQDWE